MMGGYSSGKTLVRNLNLSSVSCAKSSLPHIELRQSFASPRFAALNLIESLSRRIP